MPLRRGEERPLPSTDPQAADWSLHIETLQTQSRLAWLAKDIPGLRQLWSAELLVNTPNGRVLRREDVLERLARGVIAHVSDDERLEVLQRQGDIVVVMGCDVVVNPQSPQLVARRFTNVWQLGGASWQLIARHANAIGRS